MIEILCNGCGKPLEIVNIVFLGSELKVKTAPCGMCDAKCDEGSCDKIKEVIESIQATINQQHRDIEDHDKMMDKIRKLAEKWGGLIEKEIVEILEWEEPKDES